MVLDCPNCSRPIGEVTTTGESSFVCPGCQFKFLTLSGKLVSKNSRQITLQRQTTRQVGIYKREYEFRVETADGLRVAPLVMDGREDHILVRRGDNITIVYVLDNSGRADMLRVFDHTSGSPYFISEPVNTSTANADAGGCVVGCLIAILGTVLLSSISLGIGLLVGIAIGLPVGYLVRNMLYEDHLAKEKKRLTHTVNPVERQALSAASSLLGRKDSMVSALAVVQNDANAKNALLQKLSDLARKMEEVGDALYLTRLEHIRSGIGILQQQGLVLQELIGEYKKTITMIEIELESSQTDSRIVKSLDSKAEELARIRERNAELQRQLAAIEEVNAYLK